MLEQFARTRRPRRRWPLVLLVGVLAAGVATTVALSDGGPADAATSQSGGFTTRAATSATSVLRGQTISVTATVTASTGRTALIDLEIYNGAGAKVFQQFWDAQPFTAGVARTFTTSWSVPADEALNTHAVRVGVFSAGWGQLYHWNANGATFAVSASSATTTTPGGTRFVTLPPGAALPSDADCAARVRKTAEVRPQNATANATKGFGSPTNPPFERYKRVTGNFTGTTDEIIQWAACKWGFDEDVVRAQTAIESWWTQSSVGDNGESFGLQQVRLPYWGWAFNNGVGDAKSSSAFNMDAAMAARRNCFEGAETWLGGSYAKGDMWGCMGLWFSGRWHDQPAEQYIARTKDYLAQRVWETPNFKAG